MIDASIRDPVEFMFDPPPQDPSSPQPPNSPGVTSPTLAVNGGPVQPSSPLPSPMFPHQTPASLSPNPSSSPGSKRRSGVHNPGKHLSIEGRHFFAVDATLKVLALLADYLRVIINLETLTPDSVSRVIELLKAFNSRTCQVVLGAGAMRSAGLKNITAKHLGKLSFLLIWLGVLMGSLGSVGVAESVDYDIADTIRARDVPEAPEPEAGCHAHRVRQTEAGK